MVSYLVLPVLLGFGVEEVGECSDSWPHFAREDVATVVLCVCVCVCARTYITLDKDFYQHDEQQQFNLQNLTTYTHFVLQNLHG